MAEPAAAAVMPQATTHKALVLYLRLAMAWTFLYAGLRQVLVPDFSVVGFLSHTKTFHDFFAVFTTPTLAPLTSALVAYGHLLIGLSLLAGLMVRLSARCGALLMLVYWLAHMDWPYIENRANFIVDQHLVYAGLLLYLAAVRAGHVAGLDALAEQGSFVQRHPRLRLLFA
jgi:thiosulfate dehydrogenase [quinone] large subunit